MFETVGLKQTSELSLWKLCVGEVGMHIHSSHFPSQGPVTAPLANVCLIEVPIVLWVEHMEYVKELRVCVWLNPELNLYKSVYQYSFFHIYL